MTIKNLIVAVSLLIASFSFGQDEIKLPELDISSKVYTLEFTPDSQNKDVISAYMEGKTQKDSLRFWAEGTIFIQNVMVTVLSPDKNAKIKVDIVKNHWEDTKIDGFLKNGIFQESFDTANKFGVVITSETPNIPYSLAVWTSGEILPDMGALYINASEENTTSTQKTNQDNTSVIKENSENKDKEKDKESESNFLMIAVIGILVIIALLLGVMVFKKKKGTALLILLLIFSGQEMLHAQSQSLSSVVFNDLMSDYSSAQNLAKYARELREAGYGTRQPLDPYEDADSEADVGGGPRLPSSCIPPRYGTNSRGSSSNTSIESNTNKGTASENIEESDTDNEDDTEPSISEEDAQEYAAEKALLRQARNELNQKAQDQLDQNLYDNQKLHRELLATFQGTFNTQTEAAAGDPELIATLTTAFNTQIESLSRSHLNRIENYQSQFEQQQRLNDADYDRRLKELNERYEDDEDSGDEGQGDAKENSDSGDEKQSGGSKGAGSTGSTGSNTGGSSSSSENGSNSSEGCRCLESAYEGLDFRRLNLERLRIIYAHAMKKINAGIAFGDNVSGVHAVSGLAWQKQKLIILKESIPTLNKAYDDKYAEMIESLEENLLEIDRCEKLLGYNNWYSRSGFIYFQFIKDKYKRN